MMKPIEEITKEDIKFVKLIVFDVDGVLVPRGTKIKQEGRSITLETKAIADEQIGQLKKLKDRGFYLNINSGRSLSMLQDMFSKVMEYSSLTYENGSASWIDGEIVQHVNSFRYMGGLREKLERSAMNHPNFKGFEPKEFIITVHCKDEISAIPDIVEEHNQGLKKNNSLELYHLWNGEAYDIGVKGIQTKGVGVKALTSYLNLTRENVMAIGDNLNDKELLAEAGIAVTADKSRVSGDFYVPLEGKRLPAAVMIDCVLSPWAL
jgi:HAD superfamily hydrolase (TIGR01484 family)